MIAWLISAIVPSLADSAIKALFGLLSQEMDKRNLLALGAQQQAAKETATAAKTEKSVAQALSDAPHSRDETITILDMAKF